MEKILDEIKGAGTIGITGHIRPDGDCIGSCMAMYMYLKKTLPEDTDIDVILEEPAEIFKCIKHIDVVRKEPGRDKYDLLIIIDTSIDRIGAADAAYRNAGRTINIDHHITNQGGGDVNYIYPEASSASELAYDLMDKKYIDKDIALAIYIGIIHDTGVMQYSNTSPRTLRTVADLIEYGFDFPRLIDETFYERTYVQNQILGRTLTESILFMDGKCIVGGVSQKIMKFYGLKSKDLDGIVNQLRYTKGVEVAIFMYELETQKWKVSLRSCGGVDVADVAEYFGGGGHMRAAGCTLSGSFHDVVNNISARIALQMQ